MTIKSWLSTAIDKLETTSVPTARLDAEVLLADVLKKDRSWLLAHPEYELQGYDLGKLDEMIKRRVEHEPIAYIRGKQEFYGREFIVSPDTLTPRPETETMIDLFLKSVNSRPLTVDGELQIVDVGTGSGCIIITAVLELAPIPYPLSSIGLDISEAALKIARKNAKKLGTKVDFRYFDLTKDPLTSIFNHQSSIFILVNLPYVPEDFHINLAASHEPKFAIFGGLDGLDYYRHLFSQLSKIAIGSSRQLTVLTESLPPQHDELANIASNAGFELLAHEDFVQVFGKG